jgi:hypothetical protein
MYQHVPTRTNTYQHKHGAIPAPTVFADQLKRNANIAIDQHQQRKNKQPEV